MHFLINKSFEQVWFDVKQQFNNVAPIIFADSKIQSAAGSVIQQIDEEWPNSYKHVIYLLRNGSETELTES